MNNEEYTEDWIRLLIENTLEGRAQFEALAARQRWHIETIVQATDTTPFKLVYANDDNKTRVSYIEDGVLKLNLIFIEGNEREEMAQLIKKNVGIVLPETAVESGLRAKTEAEAVDAVYRIAATAPPASKFDTDTYEALSQLAAHEAPAVRHAVLIAAAYLQWAELVDILESLADDPDEGVRARAEASVQHAYDTYV